MQSYSRLFYIIAVDHLCWRFDSLGLLDTLTPAVPFRMPIGLSCFKLVPAQQRGDVTLASLQANQCPLENAQL